MDIIYKFIIFYLWEFLAGSFLSVFVLETASKTAEVSKLKCTDVDIERLIAKEVN